MVGQTTVINLLTLEGITGNITLVGTFRWLPGATTVLTYGLKTQRIMLMLPGGTKLVKVVGTRADMSS